MYMEEVLHWLKSEKDWNNFGVWFTSRWNYHNCMYGKHTSNNYKDFHSILLQPTNSSLWMLDER